MALRSFASWNVNGIRACAKSGFGDWFEAQDHDVLLLQEVRATLPQIPPEILLDTRYYKFWNPARVKKGYSGVALFAKEEPRRIEFGMGLEEFDGEGRVIAGEFPDYIAVGAYFPNSQDAGRRIDYKVRFCSAIHRYAAELRKSGKPVLLGGDFNVAPQPIDLARPNENETSPGYLPEERAWMAGFLDDGWVDTFRHLYPDTVKYSWWSQRTGARARNIGWRIDHFAIHRQDRERLAGADILNEVMGSDHCPVTVTMDLD
ncbi:MAG: exodeoxyribonuclease III [Bryobacterales bacterium]|nr:exodeoxyribonuclease III [Bryobacterales bacterium]